MALTNPSFIIWLLSDFGRRRLGLLIFGGAVVQKSDAVVVNAAENHVLLRITARGIVMN
jgi:hypothetical protein